MYSTPDYDPDSHWENDRIRASTIESKLREMIGEINSEPVNSASEPLSPPPPFSPSSTSDSFRPKPHVQQDIFRNSTIECQRLANTDDLLPKLFCAQTIDEYRHAISELQNRFHVEANATKFPPLAPLSPSSSSNIENSCCGKKYNSMCNNTDIPLPPIPLTSEHSVFDNSQEDENEIRSSDDVCDTLRNLIQKHHEDGELYSHSEGYKFIDRYRYIVSHYREQQIIKFLSIVGECVCCDRHMRSSTRGNNSIERSCNCACRHYRRMIPKILECYNV